MAVKDLDLEAARILGDEIIELCQNAARDYTDIGHNEIAAALVGALASLAGHEELSGYDVVGHLAASVAALRGEVKVVVPPGTGGMVN